MRTLAATAIIAGLAIPSTVVLASTGVPTYNLSAKGGTVKFSATVRNVKTCAWSSSPKVAGFDATVKCKDGKVARSARFKANTSTEAKFYAITLTVRGKSTTVDHWKVDEAGKKIPTTTTTSTTSTTTTTSSTTTTTSTMPSGGGGGGGGGTPTVVEPAPSLPTGAVDQGPLPSTTPLSVTVELNPTDPAGLQQMAQEVSDPSSPSYRHFLTSDEFTSMFGAPASAVSDVEDWATANGLSITSGSSNQLSVEVSGTASALESAFGISIDQVQLADGTDTYANLTGPSLPSAIAGAVEAVVGLDDLIPPQPADLETPTRSATTSSTTDTCLAPSGFDSPSQLESAYDFGGLTNNDATGFGERIALVETGTFDLSDIDCYKTWFPLQTPNVIPVGAGPTVPETLGTKEEVTADIETAGALAPNAQIDVYEGPHSKLGLLAIYTQIATDNQDQVVSSSWASTCDSDLHSVWYLKAVQEQLAHMVTNGQEMLVASGDQGAEACNSELSVQDPGSQPYVTSVGGTSLSISSSGQWDGETVWNDCNFETGSCTCGASLSTNCASGGGISSFWAMPSWQTGPGVISNQIESTPCPDPSTSGYCREVPDVSAAAGGNSSYYEYVDGGWIPIGGTSLAAPLWAALASRLNDYCEGPYSAPPSPRLGFLNPVLYQIAANGAGFHDITTGTNDYLQEPGLYLATPGYDMATGLGSPDASELAQSICGDGKPVISTDGTLSLPDGTVDQPYSTELTTFDHREGTWAVNAGSLPSGLSLSGYTISGTPTTPGLVSFGLMFTDTNDLTATVLATIVVSGASGGGSSWTAAEAPLPGGAASSYVDLQALACPSVVSCVATGWYDDPNGDPRALIDTLSGGTWTATEAPLPPGALSSLGATLGPIACPAVGSCVATGYYRDSNGYKQDLIETLSGGTWTATEAPFPPGLASNPAFVRDLEAIACSAVGSCVVTGDYGDSNGSREGQIDTLSGGTWTATEAPLPPGALSNPEAGLGAIACPGVGSCVATGYYLYSNDYQQSLIETLSGGTWTATEAPLPQGTAGNPDVNLYDLACSSVGSCVATGDYGDSNGYAQGLIETLSGGTWTATEAPLPQDAANNPVVNLYDLACSSVGSCVATGSYYDSNRDMQGLIDTLSGGTWTAVEAPLPEGAAISDVELEALACPSVDSCVATGSYDDSNRDAQGLIETLSGGTWTATEAPLPQDAANNPAVNLYGLACPSVGSCVATGQYLDANGRPQGLIEDMG